MNTGWRIMAGGMRLLVAICMLQAVLSSSIRLHQPQDGPAFFAYGTSVSITDFLLGFMMAHTDAIPEANNQAEEGIDKCEFVPAERKLTIPVEIIRVQKPGAFTDRLACTLLDTLSPPPRT